MTIHDETTPAPRDEHRCGHTHDGDVRQARGHRGQDRRHDFGPHGHGFGSRPLGPAFGPRPFGPRRPGASDERVSERRGGHGRQRRLDRRILRTARIVASAEHRAGRDALERTMAASVSHADHEATMRTLRTIARAVRAEHLPGRERGHGHVHGEGPFGERPQR